MENKQITITYDKNGDIKFIMIPLKKYKRGIKNEEKENKDGKEEINN